MMKLLLFIMFLLVLLTIGTSCAFFPRNVQTLASKVITIGPTSKSRLLLTFVQSDSYIVNVRVVGVGALLMFSLLVFAFYSSSGLSAHQEADVYFNSIGVNESTLTRIPGNRAR